MSKLITMGEAAQLTESLNQHHIRGAIAFGALIPVRYGNPTLLDEQEFIEKATKCGIRLRNVSLEEVAVL